MDFVATVKRDARFTILAVLGITLIYNFVTSPATLNFIPAILLTLVAGAIIELALWKIEKRPLAIPLSAVITSTIISIVLTPSLSTVHFSILAVMLALLSKHFVKLNFAHIFNPANFGALVVSLLPIAPLQSWWATSNALLLAILGVVVLYRVKGWFITLPFLATMLALTAVSSLFLNTFSPELLFATVFSGTVLFFSTVMLVEPMTTPVHSRAKVAFGVLAAFLVFIFSSVLPEVAFLAALALANVAVSFLDSWLAKSTGANV